MPHPESEHGLRVQLATALRERDEARTDAANLRFANDKARATTEKLWLERDELRAVAVNANKQTADVNALRLKQDEELVALRAERDRLEIAARAYIEGHELALARAETAESALAAARRGLPVGLEWQAILDALLFTERECGGFVSDAHARVRPKVEALAAPGDSRDPATEDADAAWRDGEAHGREK